MMEKEQQPPSSSKPIPSEIIYDILTKLPIKSLMRFRCLSKLCSSYITAPSFAELHALNFPIKTVGLLVTCPARLQTAQHFFSVDFDGGLAVPLLTIPPRFSRYTTRSVNGIILMDFGLYATLCNPSTRQTFNTPFVCSLTSPSVNSTYFCVNSFGFDPVSKKYKVLNSWAIPGRDPEYRIFELGTNSWRPLKGGPNYYPQRESVCVDGFVYFRSWVSTHKNGRTVLIAFDLHEESFRVIEIPAKALARRSESELIVYSGRPAIADHLLLEDATMTIWVLDENDGDYWVQIKVFLPEDYGEEILEEDIDYFVDCIGRNNELLLVPQTVSDSVYVIHYDVVNRSMRRAEIFGLPEDRFSDLSSNTFRVINYEENVMSFT
ncbi:F-box protein [Citrus sinensis]|nr:F-box protein At1g30790 [Citrus x clementina]XP_006484376.1 F-box protein At1g30790-like [Citrus sinensis]KAH9707661.1 F-box protein [Citrus sinensis]